MKRVKLPSTRLELPANLPVIFAQRTWITGTISIFSGLQLDDWLW
jgi:hypothetical protein